MTLNNAKSLMFNFKYDFLGQILLPMASRATEMDTDSMQLVLTRSKNNECMTAEAKKMYFN